jgi:hypothetical protein
MRGICTNLRDYLTFVIFKRNYYYNYHLNVQVTLKNLKVNI